MREPLIEKPGRLEVDCHYDHSCSLTDRWIACPVHLLLDVEQVNVWDMDYQKIAEEYAIKHGKDTVCQAGERNGYKYFHVFSNKTKGHKIGPYQYIKISTNGTVIKIYDLQEIMWAGEQESLLNKS